MWRLPSAHVCQLLGKRSSVGYTIIRRRTIQVNDVNTYYGTKQEFQVGTEFEGFVVKKLTSVPEFNIIAAILNHNETGTEYLHLFRNDSNNAFSINFHTPTTDSTGIPYILERAAMCGGSFRFPCKDPFDKMLRRSMSSFMNALVGPDYTMYPFVTHNPRDFNNLMSVYLDLVFKPRLREVDFLHEGWRLEHEDLKNPDSRIILKGNVLNEMKSRFSDPRYLFGQMLIKCLLPDTYGHFSGGDPFEIPRLSYEGLKTFHKTFYSPANAKFFSYGNFPLAEHLTYLNQNYLCVYDKKSVLAKKPEVPLERIWKEPKRKHLTCKVDPLATNPNKQSFISIGVLLHDICDLESSFEWNILSELLLNGPNSTFYKTFVESNIGSGFAPGTGFQYQTRNTFFAVGLQGVAQEDFDRVVDIFEKTTNDVIQKGFDPLLVEAIIHGIELKVKNEVSNYGLGMLLGITPLWNHNGNVLRALQINEQINNFRKRIQMNPKLLQEIMESKIKMNPHKLILTMSPDEAHEDRLLHEEKIILESKTNSLTPKDKNIIMKKGQELMTEQNYSHDASCLPTLLLDEINPMVKAIAIKDITLKGVPVQTLALPTNSLVYFRGILNASFLTKQQKKLIPLFASVVTKVDTNISSYYELDKRVILKTGGVTFVPHVSENLFDVQLYEQGLMFFSYALDRNVGDMFSILSEIINDCKFEDVDRFAALVNMIAVGHSTCLLDRAGHYAVLSAGSIINGSLLYKEQLCGLSFVDEIRKLAQLDDLSPIIEELRVIASGVLNKNHLRCAINYSPSTATEVLNSTETFLHSLSGRVKDPFVITRVEETEHPHSAVHHVLPTTGNYLAKAITAVAYTHSDFAPLTVVARLLSSKYLHQLVRRKGGAHASGAFVSMSGTFMFFSHRDPNPSTTLDIFDDAAEWVSQSNITTQDFDEAMFEVFQALDEPIPPGQKGMDCFLYGVTDSILQQYRERLIAVTINDLYDVSERYLSNQTIKSSGYAVIGPVNPDLPLQRSAQSWLVKSYD